MNIVVETAIELDGSQVQEIEKKINKLITGKKSISYQVDPNIIGGMRIITPHKTVDMSLAARLDLVNQALQKAE